MNKKISKLEISKLNKLNDQTSMNSSEELSEDLLSAQEMSDVEGGWCDYTCFACTSNGMIGL